MARAGGVGKEGVGGGFDGPGRDPNSSGAAGGGNRGDGRAGAVGKPGVGGGFDGNKKSSNADRDAATRAKQADLQSYGATPLGSEPTRAELDSLGDAIDRMSRESTGVSGMLNDLFGINQRIEKNPKTNSWDVWSGMEIDPLAIGANMVGSAVAGPLGGKVAGWAAGQLGNPLGFEIGGFASEREKPEKNDQRDGDRGNGLGASPTVADIAPQTPANNSNTQVSEIDKFIENLLKQFQFTVFDMPDFALLDPNFGKVQSEELKKIFDSLPVKQNGAS